MSAAYKLELSDEQKTELEEARRRHPKAYVRERAAAILKVAAGESIRQVALRGLLRRREPEIIKEWIDRYLAEGLPGLKVRPGRGRKPVFSPSGQRDCGSGGGASPSPTAEALWDSPQSLAFAGCRPSAELAEWCQ
jgi:hypothetical protein